MVTTNELNKKTVGAGPVSAQKGITLIALVITIIVMLILVSVTISMAVDGGLFDYAGKAVGDTNNAIKAEQQLINDIIDEYIKPNLPENEPPQVETIPTTTSYVGCYADIEGVEGIDGIIYADLARGNTKGEKWADDNGVYTIPVETGLKEYYVSGTAIGPFGTEPIDVIKAVSGTTGKDRFYVMALENVGSASTYYHWYDAASGNMSDYETATSGDFGKGKENTTNMIAKWDIGAGEGGYGAQDTGSYKDIWGQIKAQVSNGWFVPSRGEWAAFAQELGITSSNYTVYGLGRWYWSSSQLLTDYAWDVFFDDCSLGVSTVGTPLYVRLSATF